MWIRPAMDAGFATGFVIGARAWRPFCCVLAWSLDRAMGGCHVP